MLPSWMPHVVCSLEASCRRPFDVRGLLEFFAARALPGVEVVDTERLLYCRTIDLARLSPDAPESGPRLGVLRVDFGGSRLSAEVHATAGEGLESCREEEVELRVRRLFDLDANPDAIRSGLSDHRELASGGQSSAGVRIPGAWCRFETAVRAVLGQQISVAGARTLAGRLVAAAGRELPSGLIEPGLERTFPGPDQVASLDLRTIGLPGSRARALGDLASEVATGALRLDADPREVRRRLLDIKGIGPWTVEYIAMRALGDRDAFPASDLGLRKAIDRDQPPGAAELEAMAEAWRPMRAYAAILLWRRGGGG
ncbi:MAG: DNA-3-methyladenine glycosylase 2 family protein [Holophagales bacterium]|nr:DNA-3-methyladenine glycosylase 2 family protein [Holophagales bacterium]MXX62638.1 DNA-3-methyladenine glycosylase 2 family protein [Holophagales bacterium]MYC09487.1 DNA-3-methyladenine glycosylase 2 family protein [Holophagales bacterium]MYD21686.1 DNA-3-methyladenine glycosylase 2 family protein [Holophagales bacterium]MYI32117.1 DNA-3-methyladenine glycosylase 2 family protein [Holophagales bacterium]